MYSACPDCQLTRNNFDCWEFEEDDSALFAHFCRCPLGPFVPNQCPFNFETLWVLLKGLSFKADFRSLKGRPWHPNSNGISIRINQLPVSAARWQHEFGYVSWLILQKNHKIVNNFTTTEAKEKMSIDLESLELKKIDACLTKLNTIQILLDTINC